MEWIAKHRIEAGIALDKEEPHEHQALIKAEANRFNVLAMGRRWGKTLLGEDVITDDELLTFPVGWFSPTYKMLLEVWRDLKRLLQPITLRSSIQERRIELFTGGVVELWSLDNPDVARGRKYRRIIVDEAALVKDLALVVGRSQT